MWGDDNKKKSPESFQKQLRSLKVVPPLNLFNLQLCSCGLEMLAEENQISILKMQSCCYDNL